MSTRPVPPRPAFSHAAGWSLLFALLSSPAARAVPSFARQTGLSCAQCHTAFPELTAMGRTFKAGGYTMSTTKALTDKVGERSTLDLVSVPPLSVMVEASLSHTSEAQSLDPARPRALNDDVLVPQQLSLFYAGKLAPRLGGLLQLTYDGVTDKLTIDNVDVRFAHTLQLFDQELVAGLTVNNNPTVTDLWNSTPAWGVPFASAAAPSPGAAPLVAGGLAQTVAGLSAYALWNNFLYLEAAAYHAAPVGMPRPLEAATGAAGVVHGLAPYWRAAVQKNFGSQSLTVGTFGLVASLFPGGTVPLAGKTNRFVDAAVDAQYQYVGESHILTAVASFIHESQQRDADFDSGAAAHAGNALNAATVSASYLYQRLIGGRLTFLNVAGTSDSGLYAPAPTVGFANGSPDSMSLSAEATWLPWLNSQFVLRYTFHLRFNGAGTDYDGSGRDASANNTLYLLAWLAY